MGQAASSGPEVPPPTPPRPRRHGAAGDVLSDAQPAPHDSGTIGGGATFSLLRYARQVAASVVAQPAGVHGRPSGANLTGDRFDSDTEDFGPVLFETVNWNVRSGELELPDEHGNMTSSQTPLVSGNQRSGSVEAIHAGKIGIILTGRETDSETDVDNMSIQLQQSEPQRLEACSTVDGGGKPPADDTAVSAGDAAGRVGSADLARRRSGPPAILVQPDNPDISLPVPLAGTHRLRTRSETAGSGEPRSQEDTASLLDVPCVRVRRPRSRSQTSTVSSDSFGERPWSQLDDDQEPGVVAHWLHQLSTWVSLQPRGKSQSVETAGGSPRQSRTSATAAAPGGATGMAHRSLDSAWPPSLSRGSSTTSQPEKTEMAPKLVKYTVQERDTLTSIAARFDSLPTEVMKANRLGARLVFPGQVLLVPSRLPDPGSTDPVAQGGGPGGGGPAAAAAAAAEAAAVEEVAGPRSRASTRDSTATDDTELDQDCLMKYVKIKTRHITDGQGVVTGTLLVTPNCLMFDPNVSDSLVLEHGADKYGVMVPMDYIVSAALFTDIAHMKVKDRGNIPLPDLPRPEVYHAPPKAAAAPAPAESPPPPPPADPPAAAEDSSDAAAAGEEGDRGDAADAAEGEATAGSVAEETADPLTVAATNQEAAEDAVETKTSDGASLEGKADPAAPVEKQRSEEASPPTEAERSLATDPRSFPELSLKAAGSVEEEDAPDPARQDSSAFPKAFERDLVSPEVRRGSSVGDGDGTVAPPAVKDTMTDSAISLGGESVEPRAVQFTQHASAEEGGDETKKQKVWKRLSHPLTWMESLSGVQDREPTPSSAPPHLENSPKSMLSNVVSSVSSVSSAIVSSPRYIVDLGSGLLSSLSPGDVEGVGTPPTSAGSQARDSGAESRTASVSVSDDDVRCREGNSVFYTERSSVDRKPRAQSSFGGYKNLVSMDERPSLFTSFDELIPKRSQPVDDPPLYLCLIMGKRKGRRIRKTVRIMSYGEEKLRSEFWFSIPRDKCDQLYHFIQYWAPEIYGSLEDTKPDERGFELVDSDSDIWDVDEGGAAVADSASGDTGLMDLPRQLPKQSWEMGGMSEELRRALYSNSMTSMDMEFVPDLRGNSEILTDDIRKNLCKKIPPRVEGYPWSLIFSSSEHGFSLKSLYRKASAYECPMLLFVQDTNDHTFGALCSSPIHMSEHYYGTGETFLFTFHNSFRTYGWSGENLYFTRGSPDGLEFGSGDGHYGLYLDGDLYKGRTQPCLTYQNEPLTSSQDFIVRTVELWALT